MIGLPAGFTFEDNAKHSEIECWHIVIYTKLIYNQLIQKLIYNQLSIYNACRKDHSSAEQRN